MICDNSDKIEDIQVHSGSQKFGPQHSNQVYAMVLPDHEINPRVPCTSNLLPRIDLTRLLLLKPLLNACKPDVLALLKNCEKGKFKQIKL